jgi:cyclopropane fatty-acyl-phospholipid synthase-like methyltransferase
LRKFIIVPIDKMGMSKSLSNTNDSEIDSRQCWQSWFTCAGTVEENPPCSLCSSPKTLHIKENQVAYKNRRFSIYECLTCGVWFSPGGDRAYISNDDYYEVFSAAQRQTAASIRFSVIEGAGLRNYTKIVEIGCSLGDVLSRVKEVCPDALLCGIENSEKMASYVKERGLTCVTEVSKLPFRADFIYANHVFEHFHHPAEFFQLLEKIGEESFEVRITFPNRDNYFIKKGFFPDLHLPHHRFYYRLGEVRALFEKAGYEVLETRTLEQSRFAWNARQALYNEFREDLELFRRVFPDQQEKLKRKLDEGVTQLETWIESQDLGSEGLLHARKKSGIAG